MDHGQGLGRGGSRILRLPSGRLLRGRGLGQPLLGDLTPDFAVYLLARRTGTALACIAVLDGVPGREAVVFVRERYDARAVETPWHGGTSPGSHVVTRPACRRP